MLTIDALRRFGANTEEGLARCMNNEELYLRFVNIVLDDAGFDRLADAVGRGDRKTAFEAAHALKGVLGNLSLGTLYDSVSGITELLRAKQEADYPALVRDILRQRDSLLALRG